MQNAKADGVILNPLELFKSYDERIANEESERLDRALSAIPFGINYLDDALGGIYKNELILIGAKTGFGKTQLAVHIALNAARVGKRVNFFALEAEENEIERRIKYQMIADEFFKNDHHKAFRLNYLDWYRFKLSEELRDIESKISKREHVYPTLKTFYRSGDFSGRDFERMFLSIKDETDLVIIDHLHYFDIESENENREMKNIVKGIRDCALISGKPIILIAHLRKTDKKIKALIPDLEDFHGSSDISKICTTAVTIAPVPGCNERDYKKTFLKILKHRADASRCVGMAQMKYIFAEQRYGEDYVLGTSSLDGSEFLHMADHELPHWAKNARRTKNG